MTDSATNHSVSTDDEVVWIIQLSDLHLQENRASSLTPNVCVNRLSVAVKMRIPQGARIALVVCGDLTSKGDIHGYNLSYDFLQGLCAELSGYSISIFCLPGNHDISTESEAFAPFNRFAMRLNSNYIYSDRGAVVVAHWGEQDVVLINSAHHKNQSYGQVCIEKLSHAFATRRTGKKCIVAVHHHLVPYEGDKQASIRNAREFIDLCSAHMASGILHGHCHQEGLMRIGTTTIAHVIGVGSLFSLPGPNLNNAFNVLAIKQGDISRIYRYRYCADRHSIAGNTGCFEEKETSRL